MKKLLVAIAALLVILTASSSVARAADPDPKTLCRSAGSLFQQERYTEAKAAYVSLLGAPECDEAADRIVLIAKKEKVAAARKAKAEELKKEKDKGWAGRNRETVDSWGKYLEFAGAVLLWIGKALLLALGLMWFCWFVVSQYRKYLRRMVRVEPIVGLDEAAAAALRASFKNVLQKMAESGPAKGAKPSIVQLSTEPDFKLPDSVTSAEPKTALVNAMLDLIAKFAPTRDVCVEATCHPIDAEMGAGISVEVERPRGRLSKHWSRPTSVTIWESDFAIRPDGESAELNSRYERLIQLGSIWIAFENGNAERGRKNARIHRKFLRTFHINIAPDEPPFTILGTSTWRSYAFSTAAELAPDKKHRVPLLERALDVDPENLIARLNLAIQLVTHPAPGLERTKYDLDLQTAMTHLDHVIERLSGTELDEQHQMLRYRALYIRAIANYSIASEVSLSAALRDLDRIKSTAAEKREPGSDVGRLLVRMAEPASMVRYAVHLKQKKPAHAPPTADDGRWISADSEYARSCAWAAYADAGGKSIRAENEARAVAHLRRAIERRESFKEIARGDWSLKPLAKNDAFNALVAEPDAPAKDPPQQLDISLKLDKATRSLFKRIRA